MDIKIKAIHFDATEKLEAFITKKVEKLKKFNEDIIGAEVTLKVVKPETSMNKEAGVKLKVPQCDELYAAKTADTFEEAIDLSVEALQKQLMKQKEKNKN